MREEEEKAEGPVVFRNVWCNYCRKGTDQVERDDHMVVCRECRLNSDQAVKAHLYCLPDDTDSQMEVII